MRIRQRESERLERSIPAEHLGQSRVYAVGDGIYRLRNLASPVSAAAAWQPPALALTPAGNQFALEFAPWVGHRSRCRWSRARPGGQGRLDTRGAVSQRSAKATTSRTAASSQPHRAPCGSSLFGPLASRRRRARSVHRLRFLVPAPGRVAARPTADRASGPVKPSSDFSRAAALRLQPCDRHSLIGAQLPIRLPFFPRDTLLA